MAHLIPCPSCHSHVMEAERVCPHCGVALRTVTASRAPAVLLGLALTGCPTAEAVYGVPDTGSPTTATTGETDTDTDTGTSGGQTTMADSGSGSSMGTASESGTATDGSSGTTGSSSVGEPEYGVPETTGTGTGTGTTSG